MQPIENTIYRMENIEGIEDYIIYTIHTYFRELLGELVYLVISVLFLLLGLLIFLGAITNSNILLGNPANRDKSQLGEIEYRRTRTILRTILSFVGIILIVYNVIGLTI